MHDDSVCVDSQGVRELVQGLKLDALGPSLLQGDQRGTPNTCDGRELFLRLALRHSQLADAQSHGVIVSIPRMYGIPQVHKAIIEAWALSALREYLALLLPHVKPWGHFDSY